MDQDTILNNLDENGFIKLLCAIENILIVGESDGVKRLREIRGGDGRVYFHALDITNHDTAIDAEIHLDESIPLAGLMAVIIVGFIDEQVVSTICSRWFSKHLPGVPLLRLFADVFVNFLAGRDLLSIPDFQPAIPNLSYAIVTTPRSGSTFLCSLLQSTGIAGVPTEHMRQASATLALNCGFDYIQALRRIMGNKVTRNGVFGTKFISHFLQNFEAAGRGFDELFEKYFSKFIYVKRGDRVAQAVSAYLARRTNIWHITNDGERGAYENKLSELMVGDDSLEDIYIQYMELCEQEAYLENLLDKYKVEPLVVEYERLVQDPILSVDRILGHIGVQDKLKSRLNPSSRIKKLGSELSDRVADKFREKYLSSVSVKVSVPSPENEGKDASLSIDELLTEGRLAMKNGEIANAAEFFKKACALNPSVPLSYQEKDIEIATYDFFTIKNEALGKEVSIRGTKFDLETDSYFSCLGQAFTRGRFVDLPYPSLLRNYLSINSLNLGFAGIGPGFFISKDNRWLLDLCNQGKFTVVLLMSGMSIEARQGKAGLGIVDSNAGESYFDIYKKNRLEFDVIHAELIEKYIDQYIKLSSLISTPKILLWFSGRSPKSENGIFKEGCYEFPDFIYAEAVNRIRPFYDFYVECSSNRGLPQRLMSKITSMPCVNCEGMEYNRHYPSPEMHEDVAGMLVPVCKSILSG